MTPGGNLDCFHFWLLGAEPVWTILLRLLMQAPTFISYSLEENPLVTRGVDISARLWRVILVSLIETGDLPTVGGTVPWDGLLVSDCVGYVTTTAT